MAIQQFKKQSDLEKRLQILRRQVYGKSSENKETLGKLENQKIQKVKESFLYTSTQSQASASSFRTDISYLNQDLLKILLFSSLAIGLQILLFFLMKNNILNTNFF